MESHAGSLEAESLDLPIGSRAIVASDLFLGAEPSEASTSATREVALALEGFEGGGAVIFAGNLFDLLGNNTTDPGPALLAHPELDDALRAFLGVDPCRRVIVLPGTRDRAVLFDPTARGALEERGIRVARSVDLRVDT
ncbi:MAG TPA: hypothetical protein VGS21_08070, partial [Acidimicrobiales bacterium]|nr:hypothetical protein [Acidimicrobiales bacterium]